MASQFTNPWEPNPLMTLVTMIYFWFLMFLLPILFEWWQEIGDYRRAVREADLFLAATEEQIKAEFDKRPGALYLLRDKMYDYEDRERIVKRPIQSWALIPYAEDVLGAVETLPDA